MSLIRNEKGSATNQALTAKRFVAGEPLSGNSYKPIEYIQVTAGYLTIYESPVFINPVSSFVIKAEFSQNSAGTLIGRADGLQIIKDGSYIKWKNSSTVLHQVTWKEGLHLYGFIQTNSGIAPYYDGNVITLEPPISSIPNMPMVIGVATDSNGDVTGEPISGSWSFRVSEIIGNLLLSKDGVNKQMIFHWYATRRGSGQTPIMFETRSDLFHADMGCAEAQGRTYTGGEDVTYGMQVDDMKTICKSPYNNLLMILTSDGGEDRGAGWRPRGESDPFDCNLAAVAETFTDGDNHTHRTAFYMPADIISGISSVNPPSGTWETGQLFRGRKPNWNIWNNAVRAFKYLKHVPAGAQGQYTGYKLLFNIFKDCYGRDMSAYVESDPEQTDQLLCFDGYSESSAASHAPFVDTSGVAPSIDFYCDVNYAVSSEKDYNGLYKTYVYDQTGNGTMKVCLGNLPWWNFTKAQLDAGYYSAGHTLRTYGVYASIDVCGAGGNWMNIASFTSLTPIKDSQNNPLPFCSDYVNSGVASIEAVREQFQETGVDAQLTYGGQVVDFMRFQETGDLYTRVNVRMANTMTITNPDIHTIDCSEVFPPKLIDTKIIKHQDTLRLVGDVGGIVTKYDSEEVSKSIFLKDYNGKCEQFFKVDLNASYPDPSENSKDAFGIRFALVPSSVTSPQTSDAIDLFDAKGDTGEFRNPRYLVYARCVIMRSWADMLGAPAEKVHMVEELPSTGSQGHYYIDIVKQKIYHRKQVDGAWTWVEDPEVKVSPRPETGDTDKTYLVGGVEYPWRYGEDGEWHQLEFWYKQGEMRNKLTGWAQPFHRMDVNGSLFTNTIGGYPCSTSNTYLRTNNKSVSVMWGSTAMAEQPEEVKNAMAVFYIDHLKQSGANRVPLMPGSAYDYEPSVIRYQVFEAAYAPHSCGPCAVSNIVLAHKSYVSFLDRLENYVFFQNQNETGYRYAVVGDDALIKKGTNPNATGYMLRANLRLFDGDWADKTNVDADFKPFYLTVYKQLPCRPASQADAAGNYEFDGDFRISTIFEDKLISSPGSGGSVTIGGKTYSYYLTAARAIDGAYPNVTPATYTTKTMIYEPECFELTVTTLESNIEPGAKYLFRIAFA